MSTAIGIGISPANLKQGGAFNLEGYLATLAASSYWDFTKTDRHYQDAVTIADDVGEVIGLAMDQASWAKRTLAQQIAQAPEEITQSTAGAVVGVIGSGGALPTGMVRQAVAGITHEVLSVWPDRFRIRIYGTNTSGGTGFCGLLFVPSGAGGLLGTTALTRRFSYGVALVGGSLTNLSITQGQNEFNSSGGYVTTTTGRTITPGALADWVSFVTPVVASTAYVQPIVNMAVGAGLAIDATLDVYLPSVKQIAGKHGLQATGSLKPTRQTTGAKFDGADDNLLTSYLAGGSGNFLAGLLTIPATIASTQVIAGLQDGTPSGLSLSVSTGGLIGGRIGTTSLTGSGASDQRGNRVPVAITCDGSAWRLFVGTAQENQGSASGMGTTVPLRLGALNNNGAASAFFGGSIERFVAGRDYLDLSRWLQIRSALLAA